MSLEIMITTVSVSVLSIVTVVPHCVWLQSWCLLVCLSVMLTNEVCIMFDQDVLVVYCSPDFYHKTKVLATARMALKQQGIVGLCQAPCLRALLSNLPVILQEQHTSEKVSASRWAAIVWLLWYLRIFSVTSVTKYWFLIKALTVI